MNLLDCLKPENTVDLEQGVFLLSTGRSKGLVQFVFKIDNGDVILLSINDLVDGAHTIDEVIPSVFNPMREFEMHFGGFCGVRDKIQVLHQNQYVKGGIRIGKSDIFAFDEISSIVSAINHQDITDEDTFCVTGHTHLSLKAVQRMIETRNIVVVEANPFDLFSKSETLWHDLMQRTGQFGKFAINSPTLETAN